MWKKILFTLLGLIVLLVLVGFLLPGKLEVTRSISVNAPPQYSFEEVNALENWKNWSYWNTLDANMKVTYGDKNSGAGGSYSWESEELGNGKLIITESKPYGSIKADLDFIENGTATSWYIFEPEGENTKLTMGMTTEFGYNPFSRWFGFAMMEPEMNKAFEYDLQKIKELAESKPKFSVKITEERVAPIHYIGKSHSMSPKDPQAVADQMGKMYGELAGALAKAKAEANGHPFCIYTSFTPESMDMICALPVAPDVKLSAKYPVMLTGGGKAVKAIHAGDYSKLEATHMQVSKYVEFRKLEVGGAPWEVYVTDPGTEPDTSKWITEIYYPIK